MISLADSASVLWKVSFYSHSDELWGVSFADEDFEQPQFGFDMLVFAVLHCQWGAVLLLRVSVVTRKQTLEKWDGSGVEEQFCVSLLIFLTQYLPFCLKNWSSNSFRFLRNLFFSSRVSWSCSTSSCLYECEQNYLSISL